MKTCANNHPTINFFEPLKQCPLCEIVELLERANAENFRLRALLRENKEANKEPVTHNHIV